MMKAKGAIRGKNALAFAKRAKKKDFTDMILSKLIPLMNLKKNMVVVDFCTGTGNIIPFFKARVKEFNAIDASDEMVSIMKKEFGKFKNIRIIESDVSNVPLKTNSCDVVIIKFSLHHIYNADPVVKEAYRILKKDIVEKRRKILYH